MSSDLVKSFEFDDLLIFATRYLVSHDTIHSGFHAMQLIEHWPALSSKARLLIESDVRAHTERASLCGARIDKICFALLQKAEQCKEAQSIG